MARKSITSIMEEIKQILEKEKELSIRQLSIELKSQWRTIEKALQTLTNLGIVKERRNKDTKRVERLFSLNSKN